TIVSHARRSPRFARSTSSASSSGRSTTGRSTPGPTLGFRPMLARVARYEVNQDRLTDAVEAFNDAGREIEQLEGFLGGYVLVDHEDGRTMTLTLWESDEALQESESTARSARNRAAAAVDGAVLSVEKFEVALELRAQAGAL